MAVKGFAGHETVSFTPAAVVACYMIDASQSSEVWMWMGKPSRGVRRWPRCRWCALGRLARNARHEARR